MKKVIKFLIKLGALKGKRHQIAEAKACAEYHAMGLGA